MVSKKKDWLQRPLPELNVMFANVRKKIADYQADYGLTSGWIDRVNLICDTFTTGYTALVSTQVL